MATHKVIKVVDSVPYDIDWGTIRYLDNFTHIVEFLDLAAETMWNQVYTTGTELTEDSLETVMDGVAFTSLLGVWGVMLPGDKLALRRAIKDTADDYRYMMFNRDMECGHVDSGIEEACGIIFELNQRLNGHPLEVCGGLISQELVGILQPAVIQSVLTSVSETFDKFSVIFKEQLLCSVLALHRPRYGMCKIELNFMLEELL